MTTRSPRRLLTDWTTAAGVGGDGLLALVAGPDVSPEGIHLATLGYEVFVLGAGDDVAHVHHVETDSVPGEWAARFALVVGVETTDVPAATVADGGLLVVLAADEPAVPDGFTTVLAQHVADPETGEQRHRVVLARL